MRVAIILTSSIVMGCAQQPTLEELEDAALISGDWKAVERREEVMTESLETRGPGCTKGLNKYCAEEPEGIQCYCLPPGNDPK